MRRRQSCQGPTTGVWGNRLTCPSSLSGSAAESAAMHEMARLRVAARVDPSWAKSTSLHAADASALRRKPKRRNTSLRMSMHSSFT
eukprot:scaffold2222_cov28-Tisochrysis_lutea.AAC.2